MAFSAVSLGSDKYLLRDDPPKDGRFSKEWRRTAYDMLRRNSLKPAEKIQLCRKTGSVNTSSSRVKRSHPGALPPKKHAGNWRWDKSTQPGAAQPCQSVLKIRGRIGFLNQSNCSHCTQPSWTCVPSVVFAGVQPDLQEDSEMPRAGVCGRMRCDAFHLMKFALVDW